MSVQDTREWAYKRGYIDAGPVIKVLKRWLSEQDSPKGLRTSDPRKRADTELGSIGKLSHWTGIKHDTLYAYSTKHKQWMPFDTADKIICHTYGPLMWRSDPVLEECYQSFCFDFLDVNLPTSRAA